MPKKQRVILIIPARNEEVKIVDLVKRVPLEFIDSVLVVDDASSDNTAAMAKLQGAEVISCQKRVGCGPAIRLGIDYACKCGFDIIAVMAGNGKDDPSELFKLINPIINDNFDFVQGSRYLKGGKWANMPLHRILGTKGYSFLFSLLSGRRITDGTNGFRSFRASILGDKRINLWQDWINNYELESYLYFKAVILGYKFKEVPVTKLYPKDSTVGYTQMKAFSGWWSHFRPILLLRLGIKK